MPSGVVFKKKLRLSGNVLRLAEIVVRSGKKSQKEQNRRTSRRFIFKTLFATGISDKGAVNSIVLFILLDPTK
jgi:hypothetical protein